MKKLGKRKCFYIVAVRFITKENVFSIISYFIIDDSPVGCLTRYAINLFWHICNFSI